MKKGNGTYIERAASSERGSLADLRKIPPNLEINIARESFDVPIAKEDVDAIAVKGLC